MSIELDGMDTKNIYDILRPQEAGQVVRARKKKRSELDDAEDYEYTSDAKDNAVDIGGWSQKRSMCDDGADDDNGGDGANGDDDDNDDEFLSSTSKEQDNDDFEEMGKKMGGDERHHLWRRLIPPWMRYKGLTMDLFLNVGKLI